MMKSDNTVLLNASGRMRHRKSDGVEDTPIMTSVMVDGMIVYNIIISTGGISGGIE